MVIAAIVGYLLGSFPTAQLVGRFFRIDPLENGDGNPGWWNMRHLVGDGAASIVLLIDTLKGAAAAEVGLALWGPWWTAYVGVLFAMIGHACPLFAGFRGGRAVLTFVGGMAVIAPVSTGIAAGSGLVIAMVTRRFTWGARFAIFAFPVVQAYFEPRAHVAATGALMTFIGLRFLQPFRRLAEYLPPAS